MFKFARDGATFSRHGGRRGKRLADEAMLKESAVKLAALHAAEKILRGAKAIHQMGQASGETESIA